MVVGAGLCAVRLQCARDPPYAARPRGRSGFAIDFSILAFLLTLQAARFSARS